MAGQYDIWLYAGHATPKDITLRTLPVAVVVTTSIYLYPGHATPNDIILRDPTVAAGGGGGPTQFFGLRTYYHGAVQDLALIAAGDGITGMGGIPMLRKNGTTYAVYLVETTDPQASPVRLRTTTGIKAIRQKT